MNLTRILLYILSAAILLLLVQPVLAQGTDTRTTLYQTSFDSDPKWTTNNPSGDYWDPTAAMYHFSLEPSTGNYAFTPVEYDRGSFTLEYDVILNSIDDGATFRFGFSGSEMDRSKGPAVVTEFTNAKYGQIVWLRLVTPGNKLMQMNSQHAATELEPGAYDGPTAHYELNKTYHVMVNYDDDQKIMSMKVNDKTTGREIWGYYLNTWENLHGMNRIFIGTKGDYGVMNTYARGYIDNVRLTVSPIVSQTPEEAQPVQTVPSIITTKPTPRKTTTALPTPYPTQTAKSPSSVIIVAGALGIVGAFAGFSRSRK